jgi:hypothetical protein
VVNEQIVACRRVETSKSLHALKAISEFWRNLFARVNALAVICRLSKLLQTQAFPLSIQRAIASHKVLKPWFLEISVSY